MNSSSTSTELKVHPEAYPAEKVIPFGTDIDHSEGVAVGPDGTVYAGGELGQVYRVTPDGKHTEEIACTGGFSLGITLDRHDNIYVCDLPLHTVFKIDQQGNINRFAERAGSQDLVTPNFSVFDSEGNLYVTDSGHFKANNGLIYRFTPSGTGSVFHPGPLAFPNGATLNAAEDALFVIESNKDCVTRIEIKSDGTAGDESIFCNGLAHVPDGMAFDTNGNMYVACYGLNRIYHVDPQGQVALFCEDLENAYLRTPTNVAFGGENYDQLFVGLLGARNIGLIELNQPGMPLYANR